MIIDIVGMYPSDSLKRFINIFDDDPISVASKRTFVHGHAGSIGAKDGTSQRELVTDKFECIDPTGQLNGVYPCQGDFCSDIDFHFCIHLVGALVATYQCSLFGCTSSQRNPEG